MASRTNRMAGLSFCSGVGGLELGVDLACERLGIQYELVGCVEREAFPASTLVARMEDSGLDEAVVWDDLESFESELYRGSVDLVTAGFPCQPWSSAGTRSGTSDERWIWPLIAEHLRKIGPGYVFLENVPGLLFGGIEHVLADLAACGLDAEWDVFSAEQIGAPHRRERLFILAYSNRYHQQLRVQQERVSKRQEETTPRDTGQEVVDSNGARREATWGRHQEHSGEEPQQGCCELGNTDERGGASRGRCPCGAQEEEPQPIDAGSRLFPPGRNSPEWGNVRPGLEPALCRVADGVPYRLDRLRALGNGVVPLAAAYAFCTLWARMKENQ